MRLTFNLIFISIALVVACGDDNAQGARTAVPCTASPDCMSGICLLSGYCADGCSATPCSSNARCVDAYTQESAIEARPIKACNEQWLIGYKKSAPLDIQKSNDQSVILTQTDAQTSNMLWPFESPVVHLEGLSLATAQGQVLFDPRALVAGTKPTYVFFPFSTPLLVALPKNSPTNLVMRFKADAATQAEMFTYTQTSAHNRLDLHVYYMGDETYGVAYPLFEEALSQLKSIFASAGVALVQVRHTPVRGALGDGFAVITPDETGSTDALQPMYRLSAGDAVPTLNVFMLKSLGPQLKSTAASIPGSAIHGTGASGIAVAVSTSMDASTLALRIAHESGHFMGLFHTTEPDGMVLESAQDVPICPLDRDANNDGKLDAAECEGAGADNLMFWWPASTHLTQGQKEILQRSAVLY